MVAEKGRMAEREESEEGEWRVMGRDTVLIVKRRGGRAFI